MLLFIDLEQWRTELVRSFSNLATGIATYIPLAIGAVIILAAVAAMLRLQSADAPSPAGLLEEETKTSVGDKATLAET